MGLETTALGGMCEEQGKDGLCNIKCPSWIVAKSNCESCRAPRVSEYKELGSRKMGEINRDAWSDLSKPCYQCCYENAAKMLSEGTGQKIADIHKIH